MLHAPARPHAPAPPPLTRDGCTPLLLLLQVTELLAEARAQVSGAALAALDAAVAQLRKALLAMKPHEVRGAEAAPGFVRELGLKPQVGGAAGQGAALRKLLALRLLGGCTARAPHTHMHAAPRATRPHAGHDPEFPAAPGGGGGGQRGAARRPGRPQPPVPGHRRGHAARLHVPVSQRAPHHHHYLCACRPRACSE